MNSIIPLSRLEKVPLRAAWPSEPANFTRWLAKKENIDLLADVLGIPLQVEKTEKEVGPFSADILAKEPDTGNWVVIENQLTATDHPHLGQLLTYAAGLDAKTIIWIAENFKDEHRAAIDFLNHATSEEFAFFAIQIELYKIGDSAPAPDFLIVAKPNNWSKRSQSAKQNASADDKERELAWKEYWGALIEAARGRFSALTERAPYRANWQTCELIKGGNPSFVLNAVFPWDKGLRLEIYIDRPLAKAAYRQLLERKVEIEEAFGDDLSWEELPNNQASRIAYYMPGDQKRADRASWGAQHEWILKWGPKLSDAIRPFVEHLNFSE